MGRLILGAVLAFAFALPAGADGLSELTPAQTYERSNRSSTDSLPFKPWANSEHYQQFTPDQKQAYDLYREARETARAGNWLRGGNSYYIPLAMGPETYAKSREWVEGSPSLGTYEWKPTTQDFTQWRPHFDSPLWMLRSLAAQRTASPQTSVLDFGKYVKAVNALGAEYV
ncbi:MAG: hypothetical protein VCC02_05875, partial [Myxococcota bacterium]